MGKIIWRTKTDAAKTNRWKCWKNFMTLRWHYSHCMCTPLRWKAINCQFSSHFLKYQPFWFAFLLTHLVNYIFMSSIGCGDASSQSEPNLTQCTLFLNFDSTLTWVSNPRTKLVKLKFLRQMSWSWNVFWSTVLSTSVDADIASSQMDFPLMMQCQMAGRKARYI